ncbi:DNA polymerase gamma [Novosphingobium sp. PY1]|uniref:DNA polymerase gamma n=2 Tax=Alphaproteobacteria TaxID=28211 RepID=A0A292GSB9_9HYPH|nr:DNA polymerase gamma [Ochrobactrum sp. PW1]GFM29276.1 DNA polymerase gamma [Novosphingobium sp. PY1]
MIRNSLAALGLVAALSGCTTFSNMDKGLDALQGQPIEAAFAKMGMPNSEGILAGHKVYIWSNAYSMTMPTPQTTNYQGTVGTTPYSGTASTTAWKTSEYECTIRLFVDENERINNYDYSGNIGGCGTYSSRLKPRH